MTLIDKAEVILPCPFCGSPSPRYQMGYGVRCSACDASVPCFGDDFQPWNRRAALPARGVGVPTEAQFMDAVWAALKADATDLGKQQRILTAFRAALPARDVGVPEGWHMEQLSRGNGFLFYTLRQDGWRKGEPIMVNDVTIRLEPAPGSEADLEPIAAAILAALAPTDAAQARPAWLSNCVVCGRIVDTRETDEGGDGHGCEYAEGWTCSSDCAERLHPDPDWMKEGLAAQAREAALREAAALVRAEFRLSEQDVAEGTSWAVNVGDFVADRILALISEART